MTARPLPEAVERAIRALERERCHHTDADYVGLDCTYCIRAAIAAAIEAPTRASVERRAAYLGVERVRAERDEAIALLEEARPYLVAMEDVVDDKKGEGVKPNDAMRLVGEIDRLIGGAK